jgi:hypothetical protein
MIGARMIPTLIFWNQMPQVIFFFLRKGKTPAILDLSKASSDVLHTSQTGTKYTYHYIVLIFFHDYWELSQIDVCYCTGACDLSQGKWFFDSSGPLYTNNSCPLITKTQNCQGNGRPDKGYENWRWKPKQCILPRFDARKFLELMRGKTLAFVGDSVARNQMESLLCILWQVRYFTDTTTNDFILEL